MSASTTDAPSNSIRNPSVGATGWIEVALTCLVGAALLYGLLHADRDLRVIVAFFAAFGSLYQGFTLYAILTHAIALTLLPTEAARIGVALAFSLGAATLVGTWNPLAERRHVHGEDAVEPAEVARGYR